MNITIFHTESSIDPAATVPADQIDETITNLERQYEASILAAYPGAEINFRREDNTCGHEIVGLDYDAHEDAMSTVQDILEQVYGAEGFWV
jgi:radical SAM superfamily enzyme